MKVLVAILLLSFAIEADAGALSVLVGPPAMGRGGNDALLFGGDPTQLQVAYITTGGFESSFSWFPGVLFGQRFGVGNYYMGLGGGAVVSANGGGFGPYASFGYQSGSGSGFHFNADFKQAVGMNGKHSYFASQALRIGTAYTF